MNVFRYPAKSLIGDYIRATAGLGVGAGVLVAVPPSPAIAVVFGGLSILFLVFGLRTVRRHATRIAITDNEICSAGLSTRVLRWGEVDRVRLRYFGTRRQRAHSDGDGFLQLTLKGAGRSMTLESSIDGFEFIAWRAARAARENGIALDPTTAGNLLDMGIDADAEGPPPGDP